MSIVSNRDDTNLIDLHRGHVDLLRLSPVVYCVLLTKECIARKDVGGYQPFTAVAVVFERGGTPVLFVF